MQMLKPVLTCLRMLPITEQVVLTNHAQYLVDGWFDPGQPAAAACTALLDELHRTGPFSASCIRRPRSDRPQAEPIRDADRW